MRIEDYLLSLFSYFEMSQHEESKVSIVWCVVSFSTHCPAPSAVDELHGRVHVKTTPC